jgi:eukaryotic-like serine/threonine-protein kinase
VDEKTEFKPTGGQPRRESRFTPGAMLADRFRIVALLGKGGMGEVYRAEDVKLGQQVALKFLPQTDAAKLERLYREVRLGRQVSHPNVCRLYDVMEWEGHHFISMEYIDGEDLASLLRRIGKLPHDKALDIARDVCAGLAAAHSLGIIHRDLKPANVMIDGRGTARITDFGLAALADDVRRGEMAGTPAYMAPEQLSGGEVTPRTDLYALGLILYEMFTGKRHSGSRSHSLSQETKDIEPAVQRVILRCLEERVESRPPSIHAVIAALPGGDPLQAALDAGETPSPEMVAAAGQSGELSPAIAWALLIAVVLLILLNAALSQRTMLYGKVALSKKPDVLAERSRDILARAGYTQAPVGVAYNLGWNNDYFETRHPETDLNNVRPSPVVFYYRESPRELLAMTSERRVTPLDPPLTLSRMANVELDATGRLIRFAVVPPQAEDPPAIRKPVDWSRLTAESGIDPATLHPAAPKWRAPVDSDEKVAWEGRYAEQPGVTVRIEAASYHGKPVWFSVIPPWQQIDRKTFAGAPEFSRVAQVISAIIGASSILAAFVLARRNLRRSRGDRKGAFRLALFLTTLVFYTRVFRVDHVWDIGEEIPLLGQLLSEAVLAGTVAWLLYLAVEPYFRRRWPRMLIGWTRLLAGRFRDAMVGRDALVGALAGCACAILFKLPILALAWFGRPPLSPIRTYFTALTQLRHVAYLFGNILQVSVGLALLSAFVFLLFRIVFRNPIVATVLLTASLIVILAGDGDAPIQIAFDCVIAVVMVLLFRRYGLLSLAALFAFMYILANAPITLDTSVWYFGRSFFIMALMSAVAVYAFWISLAAQPMFGLVLEED